MKSEWLRNAMSLPLRFAQVREDALLDKEVTARLGNNLSLLMIASGGCTASLLATCTNISKMTLTDINPSQIALTKFKIELLRKYRTDERLKILGHLNQAEFARKGNICAILSSLGYPEDMFGPIDIVSRLGPDYSGRYEYLFREMSNTLHVLMPDLRELIMNNAIIPFDMLEKLKQVYLEKLSLPNLVDLFGDEAAQNKLKEFSIHFFDQTVHIFNNQLLRLSDNPYVHQMLLGGFKTNAVYPWLQESCVNKTPICIYRNLGMQQALESSTETYDFIHLSNILDWLSRDQAVRLLKAVYDRLNVGGCVFIRQLNSNLMITDLYKLFYWDHNYAEDLLNRDRSFFYPKLHIGFRH